MLSILHQQKSAYINILDLISGIVAALARWIASPHWLEGALCLTYQYQLDCSGPRKEGERARWAKDAESEGQGYCYVSEVGIGIVVTGERKWKGGRREVGRLLADRDAKK